VGDFWQIFLYASWFVQFCVFASHEKYMILYKQACIGVPIGLLIFPSARTFAFEWPMCENKKKSISVLYICIYKRRRNALPIWNTFIIAQICSLSNEKSLRHRKKWSPIAIIFITHPCVTLSMTLAAYIQFYWLLNYNVDNLTKWKLRMTRNDSRQKYEYFPRINNDSLICRQKSV